MCSVTGDCDGRVQGERTVFRVRDVPVITGSSANDADFGEPWQKALVAAAGKASRFDSLPDARRTLTIWRHDYNNVRPHSSLGSKTPAEARRALEQSGGSAPGTLARPETDAYQTNGLSS